MAIVTNRNTMNPTDSDSEDHDLSLGSFLHQALPETEMDSVAAVRELRETE